MRQYTLEQVRELHEEQSKQFHQFTQQRLRKMWANRAEAERRTELGDEDYELDGERTRE